MSRYKSALEDIAKLSQRIEELDIKLSAPKTVSYSNVSVMRSDTNYNEDLIIKKLELERKRDIQRDKARAIRIEIINAIDELEDYKHAETLELYYIECMDILAIAKNQRNIQRIQRIINEALELIDIT